MIVTHCIFSIDKAAGGPSRSVPGMCNSVATGELKVNLLYYESPAPNKSLITNPNVSCVEALHDRHIFTGENYIKKLEECKSDIIQTHNLWTPILHYVAQYARCHQIPYIITPRGTLNPWAINYKSWKKRMALFLYQLNDLKKASCIQVTSMVEAESIRKLGINTPLALIPNNIEIDNYPEKDYEQKSRHKVLFLSRIHPKKGLEPLIKSWACLPNKIKNGWTLDIVGNYEDIKYYNSLRELIIAEKLDGIVNIINPLFGKDKINKYHEADVFILPTMDENFGMVIAEALACGVPVITTKGAPWEELVTHNCGWWIDDNSIENISNSLIDALSKPKNDLIAMGKRGRELIMTKYSSSVINNQLKLLYHWIYTGNNKPDFVI